MHRSGNKMGWGRPMHDDGPDPAEYYERAGNGGGTPERRLRLAVLLDAIAQLRRGPTHPAAIEAARWVRGEVEAIDTSFSFAVICEALDLDAARMTRALLGSSAHGSDVRLPRRQVRTQRLHGVPRRYRARRARSVTR